LSLVNIRPWDIGRYTAAELTQADMLAEQLLKRGF
jgi:hypothetical protein